MDQCQRFGVDANAACAALLVPRQHLPPMSNPQLQNTLQSTMRFDSKWFALLPIIRDICSILGIPGVSLGIVENNKTVYTTSLGYADIERKTVCDSDTIFVLGSLSKNMTAALVASLHDDGTGLASLDFLWLASNNVPYLPRSEAVRIFNPAPPIQPLRTQFMYSNFGYEVLGQVIEKASGETFAEILRRHFLSPLGLYRTYYAGESHENEAKPYAALEDGSIVPIAPPLYEENALMGSTGDVRSSVNCLLTLYKAFMGAALYEIIHPVTDSPNQPKSTIRGINQL